MADAQGFKARMLVAEEVTFGVFPTTPNHWRMPMVRPGLKASQNLLSSKALLDDANPRFVVSGNRVVSGSIELEVSPLSFGWWLKWLLGTAGTPTAVGTGAGYVTTAGYAAGIATLALGTGTGTLPVNTWVNIAGRAYRVNTTVGSPVTSITIDGGLVAAILISTPVTVIASTLGHKFTLGSTAPVSTSIELGYTDVGTYHVFTGLYVDKLGFKFTPEGLMAVTIDMEGKEFTPFASSQMSGTPTNPAHSPFSYFKATINQGANILGVVRSMEFTVSRERDKDRYVIDGTGTRASIPSGIAMIDGSLTVVYRDDALTTIGNNGTETSLRATLRDTNTALSMYLPEVRLALSTPEIQSESVVEQTIPFKAYYNDASEATSVEATLCNTTATYASM